MKKILIIISSLVLLGTLVGCAKEETTKAITVAFLPNEQDGGALDARHEALFKEIKKALGDEYEVEYILADDYDAVKTALVTGTADIAWESGATYVAAEAENENIIPLFTYGKNGDLDESGYYGYIATSSDNANDFDGLNVEESFKLLKGNSFSFVSATSTSGKVVPTSLLYDVYGPQGTKDLSSKEDIILKEDEGGIFSEVLFGGDHQGSINLIAEQKVYAGAFCCDYVQKAGVNEEDLFYINETFVPNGPMWVNTETVDLEMQNKLVEHFINIDPSNAEKSLYSTTNQEGILLDDSYRFIKVDSSFYDFVREMYKD